MVISVVKIKNSTVKRAKARVTMRWMRRSCWKFASILAWDFWRLLRSSGESLLLVFSSMNFVYDFRLVSMFIF